MSRRASHFDVVKRQNRIKITELCPFNVGAKVASWPRRGQKLAILATFFKDMDFKFVLPFTSIDIKCLNQAGSQLDPN